MVLKNSSFTGGSLQQHDDDDDDVEFVLPPSEKVPATTRYFVERNNRLIRAANEDQVASGEVPTEPTDYPTVDISAWVEPDGGRLYSQEDKDRVLAEIFTHATSAGSFNMTGHGVPDELLERLEAASRKFFQLPLVEKKLYTKGDVLTGYVALQEESIAALYGTDDENEKKDLRELYGFVYPPRYPNNVGAPDNFQGAMDEYLRHMNRLDELLHVLFSKILARAKGVSLPDDYLETAKGGMLGLMRTSHYPDTDPKYATAEKLKAHSDIATMTIIHSTARGLEEIRNSRWVRVPIRSGELHVNINEMMHYFSNGLFQNNIHRVGRQATGQDKISQVYFAANAKDPDGDSNDDGGVVPVCAEGEEPLTENRLSLPKHIANFIELYCAKK